MMLILLDTLVNWRRLLILIDLSVDTCQQYLTFVDTCWCCLAIVAACDHLLTFVDAQSDAVNAC